MRRDDGGRSAPRAGQGARSRGIEVDADWDDDVLHVGDVLVSAFALSQAGVDEGSNDSRVGAVARHWSSQQWTETRERVRTVFVVPAAVSGEGSLLAGPDAGGDFVIQFGFW